MPKYERIRMLARVLKVSPEWLVGNSDDPTPRNDVSMITNIEQPEFVQIPLVGQIACGQPILAEENIEDYVPAPVDLKECFALRCKGDSM
ncbi:MAG: XRE family transcriptional regulator, partial [Firmicutes bacterium]|nr:XRE family transcriptional regulator [Bacillota bacterium]